MSGRSERAVDDALELAQELHEDGQYRAATIIRRVCHGSVARAVTCSKLWRENLALRETVTRQAQQLAELQSQQSSMTSLERSLRI